MEPLSTREQYINGRNYVGNRELLWDTDPRMYLLRLQ
jgi:hypothetical protein